MTTRIDDVEVAHGQALLYEEIQDARLKALFAEVHDMKARIAKRVEEYRKEGRDPHDIGEADRQGDESIFQTALEITKEAAHRWFLPYGGVGL